MTTSGAAAAGLSAAKHRFVSRAVAFYVQLLTDGRCGPAAAVLRASVRALDAILEQPEGRETRKPTGKAFLVVQRLPLLILSASRQIGPPDEAALDAFDAAADLSALLGRREFSTHRRAPLEQRLFVARRRTVPRAEK